MWEVVQTYTRRWNTKPPLRKCVRTSGWRRREAGRKKRCCAWEPCLFGLYSVVACFNPTAHVVDAWCGGEVAGEEGFDLLRRHHRGKTLAVGGVGISPGRRSGVVRETAAGVAGGDLEWSGPLRPENTCNCRGQGHRIRVFCGSERPKNPGFDRSARPPRPDGLFMPPSFTSSFGINGQKSRSESVNQSPSPLVATGGPPVVGPRQAGRLSLRRGDEPFFTPSQLDFCPFYAEGRGKGKVA